MLPPRLIPPYPVASLSTGSERKAHETHTEEQKGDLPTDAEEQKGDLPTHTEEQKGDLPIDAHQMFENGHQN